MLSNFWFSGRTPLEGGKKERKKEKSEARLTANILKQDPHRWSKRMPILMGQYKPIQKCAHFQGKPLFESNKTTVK